MSTDPSASEDLDPVAADLTHRANELANVLDNPAALVQKVRDYLVEKWGDRVAAAYWITADGDRDRGIAFEIRKLRQVSLDLLLGQQSAGAGLSYDVAFNVVGPLRASIGLGVTTPLDNLGEYDLVGYMTVKF